MEKIIQVTEKYERNGWPSLPRPDLKPPTGWNLSLVTAQERLRSHQLSPDGQQIAFIKDDGQLSDVYILPAGGGWPARASTDRSPLATPPRPPGRAPLTAGLRGPRWHLEALQAAADRLGPASRFWVVVCGEAAAGPG